MYRIILGIESDAPYFSKVKIEPSLGSMKEISGSMPHPQGDIAVSYTQDGDSLNAEITLPENVTGEFVWNGKVFELEGGENSILAN